MLTESVKDEKFEKHKGMCLTMKKKHCILNNLKYISPYVLNSEKKNSKSYGMHIFHKHSLGIPIDKQLVL